MLEAVVHRVEFCDLRGAQLDDGQLAVDSFSKAHAVWKATECVGCGGAVVDSDGDRAQRAASAGYAGGPVYAQSLV